MSISILNFLILFQFKDVVSDNFEAATGSLSDHILGFVAGDRPRGIETTEKMLCEGTRLTAVGELVQTQQGKFKIQQPSNGLSYLLVKVCEVVANASTPFPKNI